MYYQVKPLLKYNHIYYFFIFYINNYINYYIYYKLWYFESSQTKRKCAYLCSRLCSLNLSQTSTLTEEWTNLRSIELLAPLRIQNNTLFKRFYCDFAVVGVNLQRMLPAFSTSCEEMVGKWEGKFCGEETSCEVDVWPELQHLTADVISRAAFGSNYEEGNRIFELQTEHAQLIFQAATSVPFPGRRYSFYTLFFKKIISINNDQRLGCLSVRFRFS